MSAVLENRSTEPTRPHALAPDAQSERFITDLAAPLGAEVRGLDARKALRPSQFLSLKRALNDRRILVFKDQHLDDAQFLHFASHFGSVFQPPANVAVLASDPYGGNTPAIVKVSNVEDGVLGNHELSAHADHHWTPVPSSGSLLYALEVPKQGGDTTWIDLVAAYEALDKGTQREIANFRLITYNPFLRRLHPLPSGEFPRYRTPDIVPLEPFEVHPLVRSHPDTGAKLLYLDEATEVEIVGVEPQYGAALIERLRAHLLQPQFAYTHHWQVGDIVYWDNQATLHARTAFDASERRLLKRISLSGSRPF